MNSSWPTAGSVDSPVAHPTNVAAASAASPAKVIYVNDDLDEEAKKAMSHFAASEDCSLPAVTECSDDVHHRHKLKIVAERRHAQYVSWRF